MLGKDVMETFADGEKKPWTWSNLRHSSFKGGPEWVVLAWQVSIVVCLVAFGIGNR